jgi:hypothetical protein
MADWLICAVWLSSNVLWCLQPSFYTPLSFEATPEAAVEATNEVWPADNEHGR